MNDDLFIKKVPAVIKALIGREAESNHRSINQEAIALLEEALLHRMESSQARRGSALAALTRYAAGLGAEAGHAAANSAMPSSASPKSS